MASDKRCHSLKVGCLSESRHARNFVVLLLVAWLLHRQDFLCAQWSAIALDFVHLVRLKGTVGAPIVIEFCSFRSVV